MITKWPGREDRLRDFNEKLFHRIVPIASMTEWVVRVES